MSEDGSVNAGLLLFFLFAMIFFHLGQKEKAQKCSSGWNVWLGFAHWKVGNTFSHLPFQMVVKFQILSIKILNKVVKE
jgi:hypothetical protein